MTEPLYAALEVLRAAEKAQAAHYRRLAAIAEDEGDEATAQRLHDLHADEQHHVSRLTARLVELGQTPEDLRNPAGADTGLDGWEDVARRLEREEVERYEQFLTRDMDPQTRALIEGILKVEVHHRDELAGKWTIA